MNKLLILGNGKSRYLNQAKLSEFNGTIWGCNSIICEPFWSHKLTRIGAIDDAAMHLINGYKDLICELRQFIPDCPIPSPIRTYCPEGEKYRPDEKFNISRDCGIITGHQMILYALEKGWSKTDIYICGFDNQKYSAIKNRNELKVHEHFVTSENLLIDRRKGRFKVKSIEEFNVIK